MMAETDTGNGRRGISWRIVGWGGAAFILLLPWMAESPWSAGDFIFMGLLMGSVGLGLELAVRKTGNTAYRAATGLALAAAFLLVWINGAVGIIGSEREDANLLYAGVLAIGLLASIVARFRPAGMGHAMIAAALTQVSVPVIASTLGPMPAAPVWSPEVVGLTGFFAAMWLLSAALFRKAAA